MKKIISEHIAKYLTIFYDGEGKLLGRIDLVSKVVRIENKYMPTDVIYNFTKAIDDYSYGYISALKRKIFIETYTASIEKNPILLHQEVADRRSMEEEKTVKTIKAAKPKKRRFWGKIATALSIFSSMIYIWRLV